MIDKIDRIPVAPLLPEVSEAAAPESTQAVYREIRRLSGVPMVALIFRHIAAYPDVLEEVWNALGPLLCAGRIQDAAWKIARSIDILELPPPFESGALAASGMTGNDLETVKITIDAYNRANPVNLLALLGILTRIGGKVATGSALTKYDWRPPTPIPGPLPDMISPGTMAASTRQLINDFGFGDRSTLHPVVPSLFRHLAHWPNLIEALHLALLPRFRDGRIADLSHSFRRALALESIRVAAKMPALVRLAARPELIETIDVFSGDIIPMMTVIGYAMRRSLA
jgi:hypothetical protein